MTLVKSSLIVNSGQVSSGQFRSLTKIASGHSKLRLVQVMTLTFDHPGCRISLNEIRRHLRLTRFRSLS